MKVFATSLRSAFCLILLMTVLLGGVYPLLVTGMAQGLFHHRANGSLLERGGVILGSTLLGQEFSSPRYFWGRPSATQPAYNAAASAASNFSPGNPRLMEAVNVRLKQLQKADPGNTQPVPSDLVTASASGLDPHISLEAARYQSGRVAVAHGITEHQVNLLIDEHTERPLLGLGGPRYVNVLRLNQALDDYSALPEKDRK